MSVGRQILEMRRWWPLLCLLLAIAGLSAPAASAKPGDVLVADPDAFSPGFLGGIFRIDPETGAISTVASGTPFEEPRGVAFDSDGSLFVADEEALDIGVPEGAVFRLDLASTAFSPVALGTPFRGGPYGIAREPSGTLLVVDDDAQPGTGAVTRVDPKTGVITTLYSGPPLLDAVGVAVLPGGDSALIIDDGAGAPGGVFLLDLATNALTRITIGVLPTAHESGIVVAPDGSAYFTDLNGGDALDNGAVRRLDLATGAVTTLIAGPAIPDPSGIALDHDGKLLVLDESLGGGALLRIDPQTGETATVAAGAPLLDPFGLAVEPPRCRGKLATVVGTNGREKLVGSDFADVIVGLGGKDRIRAGKGRDRICGGKGRDRLVGGKGRDICVGGKGDDSGKSCERGKL